MESEPSDDDTNLPAIIPPAQRGVLTKLPAAHLIPTLIAAAGDQASWRYVDFFTANIRNPNTRRAYARACHQFFAWAEERGLSLGTIRPYDVSLYIESRQQTHSAPDVKQQLAAVRMLFNWLITGQIVPHKRRSAPPRSSATANVAWHNNGAHVGSHLTATLNYMRAAQSERGAAELAYR